jgi:hypothetical protein
VTPAYRSAQALTNDYTWLPMPPGNGMSPGACPMLSGAVDVAAP